MYQSPPRDSVHPQRQSPRRGFTLIEILVVISIIAVLAGLAFPVISGVLDRAKKVQAKSDLMQIVTAVKAYYTEYGKYPLATWEQSHDVTFASDSYQDQLFNVLRANGSGRDNPTSTSPDDNQNPRRIPFLTVQDAKNPANPKGGIVPNSASTNRGMFVDPWGTPYVIRIDGNYDHTFNNPYASSAGSNPLREDAVAWSFGKDRLSTSTTTHLDAGAGSGDLKAGTDSDDVVSWQ